MFKQIIELTAQLFSLAKDIQQNKVDIKNAEQQGRELRGDFNDLRRDFNDLRREMRDLARGVERLAYELHSVSQNEAQERRVMALQLENTLLKFERRLPSGKPSPAEQED